ncbi:class II fumarate hydratase [Oceanibacterium hippocampi]|uniref:Fumarate hydratase class II n=1 Tax=Oceanibacterium hippocampi TaxID=745714 RepID=A0A1Y5TS75_9PROT|nr:class II fumarate hydratase [Oceanibacterium hippocampi]SLN70212.1 Fumarate hydratase class II [Oceanibacterium hippocampi]
MQGDEEMRVERDSLGEVRVPADRYWGAQTQRSLANFPIGGDRMPLAFIHAHALLKRVAAETNMALGNLPAEPGQAIVRAAGEVVAGRFDGHFPLVVWQTGSGTQSNMNVNEVIASRANELLGVPLDAPLDRTRPVHPNDHVNRGQSSNDSVPTTMHVATVIAFRDRLRPALDGLGDALEQKADAFADIVKTGRTHLQDAVPITLGQVFSGYTAQVRQAIGQLDAAAGPLHELAIGGTAVGTGLNAPAGFAAGVAERLSAATGAPFRVADNRFSGIAAHDAMVGFSGALNTTAVALRKIANDIRLLSSGPRTGIGEIRLPANEPGSSIMPGKVNPTQAEALAMVAAQVMGLHVAVTIAASGGELELNIAKPLIVFDVLQSIVLLGDAAASFHQRCVEGIEPDRERIALHLGRSLMLVTALAPEIGYDAAAAIAKHAHAEGLTLREAALASGRIDAESFDRLVDPATMTGE